MPVSDDASESPIAEPATSPSDATNEVVPAPVPLTPGPGRSDTIAIKVLDRDQLMGLLAEADAPDAKPWSAWGTHKDVGPVNISWLNGSRTKGVPVNSLAALYAVNEVSHVVSWWVYPDKSELRAFISDGFLFLGEDEPGTMARHRHDAMRAYLEKHELIRPEYVWNSTRNKVGWVVIGVLVGLGVLGAWVWGWGWYATGFSLAGIFAQIAESFRIRAVRKLSEVPTPWLVANREHVRPRWYQDGNRLSLAGLVVSVVSAAITVLGLVLQMNS